MNLGFNIIEYKNKAYETVAIVEEEEYKAGISFDVDLILRKGDNIYFLNMIEEAQYTPIKEDTNETT